LVELQRVRREQAIKKADSEDGEAEDGDLFGSAPPKRRKVLENKGMDDPFGPAL
jgi:cyclin H